MIEAARIEVRFLDQFEPDLLLGRKWATTRTKRLGKVGDQFVAFGQRFELTIVQDLALLDVATSHHHAEGFDSPDGFKYIWKTIHQRVGYNDTQRVYYHEFKMVATCERLTRMDDDEKT